MTQHQSAYNTYLSFNICTVADGKDAVIDCTAASATTVRDHSFLVKLENKLTRLDRN
jgi:hypothetical protein